MPTFQVQSTGLIFPISVTVAFASYEKRGTHRQAGQSEGLRPISRATGHVTAMAILSFSVFTIRFPYINENIPPTNQCNFQSQPYWVLISFPACFLASTPWPLTPSSLLPLVSHCRFLFFIARLKMKIFLKKNFQPLNRLHLSLIPVLVWTLDCLGHQLLQVLLTCRSENN